MRSLAFLHMWICAPVCMYVDNSGPDLMERLLVALADPTMQKPTEQMEHHLTICDFFCTILEYWELQALRLSHLRFFDQVQQR